MKEQATKEFHKDISSVFINPPRIPLNQCFVQRSLVGQILV